MYIETTIHAGELRHRITFYSKTTVKSSTTGTDKETWTEEYATVWAQITPQGDRKAFVGDRFTQQDIAVVSIRYRSGIDETMQADFKGRRYTVLDAMDVQERKIKMIVVLQEIHAR